MHRVILVLAVFFAVLAPSGVIPSSIYAADSCLSCHGSSDKLKTMINDDDFNKKPSEGGYG